MSSEITITGSLRVSNGALVNNYPLPQQSVDMTEGRYSAGVQEIGTSEEAISFNAELTAPGWGYFRNLDATNYVEIGLYKGATFYPLLKLKPGEWQIVRLATTTDVYAKADTAAVDLEHYVLDD